VPTCKSCGQHANVLTIDPCPNCNAKNWDEKTVLKPQSNKPTSDNAAARLIAIVLTMIFVTGGGTALWKYLRRNISHEKLTTVRYPGEWVLGEYRECDSMNLRDADRQPELDCGGSSSIAVERVFKVSFSGDLTYDDEQPEREMHYWLCRRDNDDATFSCSARRDSKPQSSEQVTSKPAVERQLSPDEVEYFRKRNECEQRFYDSKVYEVDGMSIGAVCKQNPERKP
jgi:hypothetical protein